MSTLLLFVVKTIIYNENFHGKTEKVYRPKRICEIQGRISMEM